MKILFNNNSIQFLVAVFYGRDAEHGESNNCSTAKLESAKCILLTILILFRIIAVERIAHARVHCKSRAKQLWWLEILAVAE